MLEQLRLPTNMRGPVQVFNTVPNEGEREFLRMIARADVSKVAAGGNFYIGLCDQIPTETDLLTSITTEPGATGGYARQPISRDNTGWPTELSVNEHQGIRSATATFSASGADFDTAFSRAFMCNVLSGTAGILFSYSGALLNSMLLIDRQSFSMQYEMFLD
jgi:hypothetical protein